MIVNYRPTEKETKEIGFVADTSHTLEMTRAYMTEAEEKLIEDLKTLIKPGKTVLISVSEWKEHKDGMSGDTTYYCSVTTTTLELKG